MSRGYAQKYKVAGQPFTVKTEVVANRMLELASKLIPGYPQKRKFSDAAFNMIFQAMATEIEKVEKETNPHKDISEFFISTFSA